MKNRNKIRILIIQHIFSHYRKPVFDRLLKKFDLNLLVTDMKGDIAQNQAEYSSVIKYIKYGKKSSNVFLFGFYKILNYRPDIIFHEGSVGIISLPFVLLFCKILNIKFVIWAHAINSKDRYSKNISIKTHIKWIYMRVANAVIVYSNSGKALLPKYINAQKVFVASNTLNMDKLSEIKEQLEISGKSEIKRKVGFQYRYNLIFIGRMLKEKKPSVLFDVFENLPENIRQQTAIHFVGEGECKDSLVKKAERDVYKTHFVFHGEILDEYITGELLYASDLMVMPGYLGLSVNHAFAFGCPVCSFAPGKFGPFHSPEIEYLKNDQTGILVEGNSVKEMAKHIATYLSDEPKQLRFKKNIAKCVREECSLDKMISGFDSCVNFLFPENS